MVDIIVVLMTAEVWVVVKVIGSSTSAPTFAQQQYTMSIPESTPRLKTFLTVTAQSNPSGNSLLHEVCAFLSPSFCEQIY